MSEQGQDLAGRSPSNPYVGPRPFQPGEALYGRSYEQQHLLDLLVAERIVLLYSPSGAGKTSLIQARLMPDLVKAAFFVLPVMRVNQDVSSNLLAGGDRANGARAEPNRYILSAMLSLEAGLSAEKQRTPADLLNLTFDDYLSQYPPSEGAPDNTVLIIDQFEEILTTDPTNIDAKRVFFVQLGTALRNRSRWLLCSMREEHIAGLDPYVRLVPTRLDTTFRLDLLGVEGAREAAMQPAIDAGKPFDPTLVQQMLNELRRTIIQHPDGRDDVVLGPHIEPVHLQVVFWRLWEQLRVGNGQVQQPTTTAGSDVDSALAEYYEQEIQAIVHKTGVSERAIREWFDHKLISEQGLRNQVRQGATQTDGLANKAIEELVNSHLVRSDQRLGATWFELAHDRLINPIRTSNAAWIERNLSLLQRQTTLWIRQGRPKGMLLDDEALNEAERWADADADALTPDEKEFLDQCRQAREVRQRELKYNRLLRVLVVSALLIIVGLIVAGLYILRQQRIARVQQLASQSLEAPERFPQKSLLTSLEAVHLSKQYGLAQPAATQSLHATLATIGGIPLIGPNGTVNVVAFRPGGQLLATGSSDGTVRLWRVDAPEHAIAALRGHTLGIATLAFSPDGRLLASGADDGSARIWQVDAPARPIAALGGHILSVNALAFSPDGQLLATGDLSGRARLWRVDAPQRPLAILQSSRDRSPSSVTNLVLGFSPDGKVFAVGGSDGQVQVIRVAAPLEAPKILREAGAGVIALGFSPDSSMLAIGLEDGKVLRWKIGVDASSLAPLGEDNRQSSQTISAFAFNPDGMMLATGSTNGTVLLWQLDALSSAPTVLGRHTQRVSALAFSHDGHYLATGSDDGTALLWSIAEPGREPTVLRGHEGIVRSLAFSDDERYLATGSDDGTARLWPIGAPQSEPTLLRGNAAEVRSVAFSADNSTLVSTSSDGTALRWDGLDGSVPQSTVVRKAAGLLPVMVLSPNNQWLATVEISKTVEVQEVARPEHKALIIGSAQSYPNMVLFSPDSRLLAAAGSDGTHGTAQIWQIDMPQRPPISVDSGGPGNVVLAFSPDGKVLATGSSNGIVRLWPTNVQTTPIAEMHTQSQAVIAMAFGLNGSILATGNDDGTVRRWNVAEPQPTWTVLLSRDSKVSMLAFSRDGRMLATGYDDGTVWLWNASAPQNGPAALPGRHTAKVHSIAFSFDGKLLATGSDDTTVHLWQLDSQNAEPVVLRGHQAIVIALAFSSDARYLVTGSQDTTVGLWRLQTDDLIKRACATVGRNLSVQERQGLGLTDDTDLVAQANALYQQLKRQVFGLTDSTDDQKTCDALPLHPSVYTAWLLQDKVDTALTAYTAEQQRDPTLEPPAAWLVRQAAELLRRGQLEQALALYNRAGQIDAQLDQVDVQALNQFCLTGTSERSKEALDACDRAVALAPENGDYRFNRGLVRRRAGDLEGSIKDFEAFLAIVSDQPNAGANLGLAKQWIDEMRQELRGLPTSTP